MAKFAQPGELQDVAHGIFYIWTHWDWHYRISLYYVTGDKVAIEPGVPCRMCHICHAGRYNLCTDMKFCATPPVDGNLCQYYNHPEDFCFK